MRIWTVHAPPADRTGPKAAPAGPAVLVREAGFGWGAFLFGGLWFLAHRMWLVFTLWLALTVLAGTLLPDTVAPWAGLALQLLVGFHAHDLRRWSLARRGWRLAGVVAAADEDAAYARLAEQRPELLGPLPGGAAA